MSHHIPAIVITSPVVLSLDLNTYSSTILVTPSPADTVTPELTQSAGDATTAEPDLSSKPLVGRMAGFTLIQVQVHGDVNSPFPDLESPYYDSNIQATTDPASCEATDIEQLAVGSEGVTKNENVRAVLGTDTFSPRRHGEYTRKCAEIINHLGDADALTSIQIQQIPTIDGATDVVATMVHHGTVGMEGGTGFSTYLIIGNIDDVNATVQTYPPREGVSTGKEASLDTVVRIFGAQVEELRDSPGSTSLSQTPSAFSQGASDQDLSSKLINGFVADFSSAPMESRSPLTATSNPFYEASEYEINPGGCDQTGIDNLITGTGGSLGPIHARVVLGTGTSPPQKHRQYAQKCSTITGTVNGEPISESVTLEGTLTIDGVIDVVATSTSSSTPNIDEIGSKSYPITGNVGDVDVVVYLFPFGSGQDTSYTDAVALFKTQAERLNS